MGRPINKRNFGNILDDTGLTLIADIGAGNEACWIVRQTGTRKYLVSSVAGGVTPTRSGVIRLQEADPSAQGEGQLDVSPFGAGSGDGDLEISIQDLVAVTATVAVAGDTDYDIGDILTVQGGNQSEEAVFDIDATTIVTAAIGGTPGTGYLTAEVLTTNTGDPGAGSDGTVTATNLSLITAVPILAGSGYNSDDLLTLSSGTGTAAVIEVESTEVVTSVINAGGASYSPADVLTLTGGTADTDHTATVVDVGTINGQDEGDYAANFVAGTGYAALDDIEMSDGTIVRVQTVGGGGEVQTFDITSTSTSGLADLQTLTTDTVVPSGGNDDFTMTLTITEQEIFSVSLTEAGDYTSETGLTGIATTVSPANGDNTATLDVTYGILTTSVSVAGDYTVLPSNNNHTNGGEGGGTGTDATFTDLYGILAVSLTTGGDYRTTNPTLTNGAVSSANGSGAVIDVTMGVLTVSVSVTDGVYTVVPGNDVVTTTDGGGDGNATLTVLWGINSLSIDDGGLEYTTGAILTVLSGGTGAALSVAGVDGSGTVTSTSVDAAGTGFVDLSGAIGSESAGAEHARTISQNGVKTFEGNVYTWELLVAAALASEANLESDG